ncbi:MAG TPA: 50S ribosomal protein L29 [Acidobacteriota bacterium]|nr:50S ribosomal protein L29 [Acidobacteriota bacterium]
MKAPTLREMTREELLQRINDLKDEMFNLRMRRSLKSLENPLLLRQTRRDIARIETILREDEIGKRQVARTKRSILDESDKSKKDQQR